MRSRFIAANALGIALALGIAAASASPIFLRGGTPGGGGGGSTSACDSNPTNVCAQFQSGQTFVTWPDIATGAGGNSYRYSVYASTSPINAGNYAGLTPFATDILNNSGQLFGGKIDSAGSVFTQANRQDATAPMSVLSDLGTPLAIYSGLQAHTASGTQNTYFAVVARHCTNSNCNAFDGDTFVGAVGPIAETTGTPTPIKFADSASRVSGVSGKITLTGLPLIFQAHQSNNTGGCAGACQYGDYWEFFLPAGDGNFQDGRYSAFDVQQDNAFNYPSYAHVLTLNNKDSQWAPGAGNSALESYHSGFGMTPKSYEGPANRVYLGTANMIRREILFAIDHYGIDPTQVYWSGASMGAWGGAYTGLRLLDDAGTGPLFGGMFLSIPMWRRDQDGAGYAVGGGWNTGMPFIATVSGTPPYLGTTVTAIKMADGTTWGGTGGYADVPSFVASSPGTDLPFADWQYSSNDAYTTVGEQLQAMAAFESAHRGYAAVWFMGAHDTGFTARGAIDCDWSGHDDAICYRKDKLKLGQPYIAFSNSSINDNPGTGGTLPNGMRDGSWAGGKNIGFTWNVTSDTAGGFNFTVGNAYMGRPPTAHPSTTLTGSIASSGTGTVTVTDGSVFNTIGVGTGNVYFLVGGTEIIQMASRSGNTLTLGARAQLGTGASAHSPGETIQQIKTQPTGPDGGPYATMTADVTPRRVQSFKPSNGTVLTCTITPFGAGPSTQNPTVTNGLFTLTGVTINAGGATSVSCAP